MGSRGVSRCKWRWRTSTGSGTMMQGGGGTIIQSTKRRHLPGIECCRHIHHLLSDRITATLPHTVPLPHSYTATLLVVRNFVWVRARDGGENASDEFFFSCTLIQNQLGDSGHTMTLYKSTGCGTPTQVSVCKLGQKSS